MTASRRRCLHVDVWKTAGNSSIKVPPIWFQSHLIIRVSLLLLPSLLRIRVMVVVRLNTWRFSREGVNVPLTATEIASEPSWAASAC